MYNMNHIIITHYKQNNNEDLYDNELKNSPFSALIFMFCFSSAFLLLIMLDSAQFVRKFSTREIIKKSKEKKLVFIIVRHLYLLLVCLHFVELQYCYALVIKA